MLRDYDTKGKSDFVDTENTNVSQKLDVFLRSYQIERNLKYLAVSFTPETPGKGAVLRRPNRILILTCNCAIDLGQTNTRY